MRSKIGAFYHINNFRKACGKSAFQWGFTNHSHLCPLHTDKLATCQLNEANYFFLLRLKGQFRSPR